MTVEREVTFTRLWNYGNFENFKVEVTVSGIPWASWNDELQSAIYNMFMAELLEANLKMQLVDASLKGLTVEEAYQRIVELKTSIDKPVIE
jgi:hypothetical protein